MQVTDKGLCDTWYEALVARSSQYAGLFYVGVKTTGVFCIATCRARKPKRENVEFYSDFKAALSAGFRPCKICRPTENASSAPPMVEQVMQQLRAAPKVRITDDQLRQQHISPERMRRWFSQNYGMTFQAFQRMLRVNTALQELQGGRSATDVAFDSGYDSLSGFGYTCKKLTGRAPSKAGRVILIQRFTTPIGPMFVCATERGVCLLEFVDRRMLESEFRDLQRLLAANIIAGENAHTCQAVAEVGEYFAGQRQRFSLSLETPGSDFQQAVWQQLRAVPYGTTEHYQGLAEQMGNAGAVRAVANANGANRLAIVIPCHRIIGKDGSLTGYGGGLARKEWLLAHEAKFSR